jgi:outer membrane protein assembly factor BamB
MKTRTVTIILSIWLFGTCLANGIADDYDWPRWRGPNGDGISMETDWDPGALSEGPRILWKVNVGMGFSNVVIKNNRLYTIGSSKEKNSLLCLNAETGKKIWQCLLEDFFGTQSTPTIEGKFVYVLSTEGILACVNAKNGKLRWKKDIVEEYEVQKPFYEFAGSPVVEGNLIILNANIMGMALNKRTGAKVWGSEKPPEKRYNTMDTSTGVGYHTPVIYEQRGKRYALVASYEGLYSVEVKTGRLYWLYDWDTVNAQFPTDPLVFDNKVFIIHFDYNDGSVLLDIGGGEPKVLWKNKDMWSQMSSPVVVDGYIYVCQGGPEGLIGSLRCL